MDFIKTFILPSLVNYNFVKRHISPRFMAWKVAENQ